MQFYDLAIEGDREEYDVLDDEDEVENELAHQRRHVLQGLPAVKQRVHPDGISSIKSNQYLAQFRSH